MHVLVTADTVGGVWTYAHELVTGLVRRGVACDAGQLRRDSNGGADRVDGWSARTFDFHPTAFRLEWMQEASSDIEASSRIPACRDRRVQAGPAAPEPVLLRHAAVSIPKLVVAHSDVVSWWRGGEGRRASSDSWMRWYRGAVRQG